MEFIHEDKLAAMEKNILTVIRGAGERPEVLTPGAYQTWVDIMELLLSYRKAITQFLVLEDMLRTPVQIAIDASQGDCGVYLISGPQGMTVRVIRHDTSPHVVNTGDYTKFLEAQASAPPPPGVTGIAVVCTMCGIEYLVADIAAPKICPHGHVQGV